MKKLFSGKFLFILASSLVVLVLLTIGAFYLFNDEDDVFLKSGYVLNPLSSTTEKYFFDENVGYKENLSSMVEFTDVDDKTVSVLKDSFLHYLDDSLSFLKRGAILDLSSVSGSKAVSFYNITSESIIEKKDNGYVISSKNGDIVLKDFVGRISDNKYIVVGDLSLKMAGNDTAVKGEYFEVVYVEEGIVNIENKDIKYQVAAEGTLIYVGNNKIIDLGDKKITVDGKDLMSITAITIDGNENIEIVPKEEEETEEPDENGGQDNVPTNPQPDNTAPGDGTGEGGDQEEPGDNIEKPEEEEKEEVIISLKNKKIGSTDIRVVFEILNARENDVYKLQVVNLNTGRTVDMVAQVLTDVEIVVNLLTPNTKYLFSVINEEDNGKYFQEVIETSGFGIKMEKSYATSNSLAYKVMIDKDADIRNAKLTLYKFNEETGQNEIVKDSFVDSTTGEVTETEKIISLASLKSTIAEEQEVVFDGLDSDTIYTAVLDEFSVASSNFKDIYNITITSMTLKKVPKFSDMTITKDVGAGSFDLSLGNITDPDNAIVGYTYVIYDKLENKRAIDPIYQSNASPITVKVGDDDNELKNDTNYYYNVIIEYFDNEKYIEYVTTDSIIFLMGNEPYITVVPNKDKITHESIGATIYLTDNSCLISMPGRQKCSGNSTAVVEVSEVNQLTGYRNPIFTEVVTFEVTEEDIKYDLYLNELKPGTVYNIDVRASYNTSDVLDKVEIAHTDESIRTIETKELSSFNVEWTYHQGSTDMVIYAGTQFKAPENSGTLTPEESLEIIEKVTINLYQGSSTANLDRQFPIASKDLVKSNVFNFKEKFYDNAYPVTTSPSGTFQLTMDDLKELPGANGKLGEYYIISINAYTDSGYEIKLINNVYLYRVSSILLMDDIKDPVIKIDGISNKSAGNIFENLNNDGTYVGFNISAAFDREQLVVNNIIPKKIRFYVYDKLTKEKVQFYIKDENDQLQLTDVVVGELGENNYYDAQIYMDYGSTYETVDEIMRRGNDYFIGYEVECVADRQSYFYPENKNAEVPVEYGLYEKATAQRETPSIKMYPATSDASSITYGYTISDPDNAIYKEPESETYGLYYQINSGEVIKHDLVMLEGTTVNQFEGKVKIDKLKAGDLYKLHYKVNLLRVGDSSDILTYFDGSRTTADRVFDGYFDAKNNINDYNFKYSVINDPRKDNKVTIRINAREEMLERIVAYKLSFVDSKGNTLEKEMWKLSPCANDNENDTPRCLFVDYTELKAKGMKSNIGETNNITVKVTALYDNGLTGYDFTVGNNEDDDFKYCIMQDNSSIEGVGSYISFSSSGAQVTVWTDELNAPKGYYQYAFASSTVVRYWGRHTTKITPNNISVNLTGSGYSSKNGYLNPKMISIDEMEVSGTNTFYFDSITPKVSVKQKAALINGTALNLSLSGVDLTDIKSEDGEYYVYVETWASRTFSYDLNYTIRPAVKVKIDKSNPINMISAIIDGLQENTTHYFRIFTYMRAGKSYEYTELFDASVSSDYVASVYDFKTAKASDIFFNHSVSYTSSEEIYGNRILNTKMNLLAYANNIAFNFDIIYMFCEVDSEIPCGIGEGESHIFKQTIPVSKIGTSVSDSLDISQYDLEYGKNYYMYIYAHADYYQDGVLTKRDIVLNRNSISVKLNVLREPSFVVTRNAGVSDSDGYYIDFDVVINDPDRTLVDGKYFVKLLDVDGNLVGSMKLSDGNGGYYDVSNYGEYGFDAFVVRKSMRITGLKPNAKYTFVVYNDAYLNNYSESTLPGKEHRTYEVSRTYTVYSANDYGVAFGDAITYGAAEKSIIVTFLGGSNFDNVVEVNYTVGLWNAEDDSNTVSGTFVIGENGKYFELYSGSEDWRFVIDPVGMKNILGKSYEVTISVKVKVPGTTDKYMVLTSADIPGFEGKAVYVEDDK